MARAAAPRDPWRVARATAGIVVGLYQRCGFGVSSGSPSSVCTSITRREASRRGRLDLVHVRVVADAVLDDQLARALTLLATLGLASKVCGSVFGLLMIAVTVT